MVIIAAEIAYFASGAAKRAFLMESLQRPCDRKVSHINDHVPYIDEETGRGCCAHGLHGPWPCDHCIARPPAEPDPFPVTAGAGKTLRPLPRSLSRYIFPPCSRAVARAFPSPGRV